MLAAIALHQDQMQAQKQLCRSSARSHKVQALLACRYQSCHVEQMPCQRHHATEDRGMHLLLLSCTSGDAITKACGVLRNEASRDWPAPCRSTFEAPSQMWAVLQLIDQPLVVSTPAVGGSEEPARLCPSITPSSKKGCANGFRV